MENAEMISKLNKLVQLDLDAIEAYSQALAKIDNPTIHASISQFQSDHRRHVEELSAVIRNLGGQPPMKEDIKGYLLEGITVLRSATGTEGALKAMKMNEKLTNKAYAEALNWQLPADIHALIEKNYQDEQRHLRYIEMTIETEAWKEADVSSS